MKYNQRLRNLREDFDMSQAEIAKIIKTTQSYYAQYENGYRAMPFDRVIILAKFYDVSLDYIAGLTENPKTINGKPYRISKNITVGDITNSHNINIKN